MGEDARQFQKTFCSVSRDLPDVYGDALVPKPVPGNRYKAVACSSFHCVVLDEDGHVFCMGLERGSRKMVHAPRQIRLPPGVRVLSIRNGVDAVALLGDDGVVYVCPIWRPGCPVVARCAKKMR